MELGQRNADCGVAGKASSRGVIMQEDKASCSDADLGRWSFGASRTPNREENWPCRAVSWLRVICTRVSPVRGCDSSVPTARHVPESAHNTPPRMTALPRPQRYSSGLDGLLRAPSAPKGTAGPTSL